MACVDAGYMTMLIMSMVAEARCRKTIVRGHGPRTLTLSSYHCAEDLEKWTGGSMQMFISLVPSFHTIDSGGIETHASCGMQCDFLPAQWSHTQCIAVAPGVVASSPVLNKARFL